MEGSKRDFSCKVNPDQGFGTENPSSTSRLNGIGIKYEGLRMLAGTALDLCGFSFLDFNHHINSKYVVFCNTLKTWMGVTAPIKNMFS